jgi:quinolinate synthase
MWLGSYVAKMTGRKLEVWDGECHVHAGIRPEDINAMREREPDADFLIHPECGCTTQCMEFVASGDVSAKNTYFLSTSGMLRHVRESPKDTMIVATETGILYRMRKDSPQKRLIPANENAVCQFMKMITLPKLRDALRDMKHEIRVPPEIAARALVPIERMVAIG